MKLIVRFVDFTIKHGNKSDMGQGDEWPLILEKIKEADIFIIASPIWVGHLASPAQQLIERFDAVFHESGFTKEKTGQYFTYNKVAGYLITGNEDGAHASSAQILWAMQEFGFTIPPNSNAYWVGHAGGDKNYVEAGGEKYFYTNNLLRNMVANLVFFAQLLQENPITTNFNDSEKAAEEESTPNK